MVIDHAEGGHVRRQRTERKGWLRVQQQDRIVILKGRIIPRDQLQIGLPDEHLIDAAGNRAP